MTKKILFTAAAVALGFVANPAAADPEVHRFSFEGVHYSYTVTETDRGVVYRGTMGPGQHFRLTVADGWVHGRVDGRRVSFPVSKTQEARADIADALYASR
ncbi:hypothetical protein [Stakelama tenebrarum]|uniref:Uncharacterized protein n=1 Tax=Stakelama tenebrarum TaxID=2711215 RepID=A0A6G6Y5E3_9SPHN|nr:hypothetical protein [Sphingosinithalassobacter tenebrarum]QIG79813.1 hypothetical protein G5C33_08465 [Sphingosinithalassobacter tenebrarum]